MASFEYKDDNSNEDNCVAMLIDNNGTDLLIKCDEGWLCIYDDGSTPNTWISPDARIVGILKKFYPGDSITITF